MVETHECLAPGALPSALDERTAQAVACGALRPIDTNQIFVEDHGVRFVIRAVSNLMRKDALRPHDATGNSRAPIDPFQPPEPELTVGGLSDTHIAVLNKFNVIDRHLLIVTRRFEHQEALLTLADLDALCRCVIELEGLGFYNSGAAAGASQVHKHLQVVALPLSDRSPAVPIEAIFDSSVAAETIAAMPGLPFRHSFLRFDQPLSESATVAAERALRAYHALAGAVGIAETPITAGVWQASPYNLLMTNHWMLLVPRTVEHFDGISVNALGFAGSLFVRDAQQMDAIRRHGPMSVLQTVTSL